MTHIEERIEKVHLKDWLDWTLKNKFFYNVIEMSLNAKQINK